MRVARTPAEIGNRNEDQPTEFRVNSECELGNLARQLADRAGAGDTFLLSGELGAGKTAFARAFILHLLAAHGLAEEIPSPTYTLVQNYNAGEVEIWHVDLYRIRHSSELSELGLEQAFENAICLVEWPERLGDCRPARAIEISLRITGEHTRQVALAAGPGFPT